MERKYLDSILCIIRKAKEEISFPKSCSKGEENIGLRDCYA